MAEFKDMLKYYREREGLSQREFAKIIGVSASSIGMYESGQRHPDFETEEAIADYFNVNLDTLRGKSVKETEYSEEEVKRAMRFLDQFESASPEIQSAILTLLKAHQS